jgi:DNA-entry nuclease
MARRRKRKNRFSGNSIISFLILVIIAFGAYYLNETHPEYLERFISSENTSTASGTEISFSMDEIPEFDESTPYVVINENIPDFEESDFTTECFENYSELDSLGRCGVAFANVRNRHNAYGEQRINKQYYTYWLDKCKI